jgi:hypothetical protein
MRYGAPLPGRGGGGRVPVPGSGGGERRPPAGALQTRKNWRCGNMLHADNVFETAVSRAMG